MFDHLKEYSIYIKPGFTDMRKRADSLSLLVRSEMGMDPMEKSIYILCGRDRKRVTAIVWDNNGCWSSAGSYTTSSISSERNGWTGSRQSHAT